MLNVRVGSTKCSLAIDKYKYDLHTNLYDLCTNLYDLYVSLTQCIIVNIDRSVVF